MGFLDSVQQGISKATEYAKKGAEMTDNAMKNEVRKFSDEKLREAMKRYPDNKYVLDEAYRRGL